MLRIFTVFCGIAQARLTRSERWKEDESSSVHRETVAFTMRVKPGLLEKQQRRQRRLAAILRQYIRGQSPNYRKEKDPSRGQNLDNNSWMKDVQKTFLWDSHLQVCLLRHHDRRHSEEVRATYWDVFLPVLRKGECTKSQNSLEREFTCEDWSYCFYCRSFKSVNWTIFVQSEDHKRIIPPRMMNYAKIPYKSTPWIEQEIVTLLQKLAS